MTHQHLGGLQRARLTGTSGRVLSEQTYHYDRQQRLTGLADPVAQQRSQLRYDNESHLLAVSDESAGTVREHFSYDAAGSLSSLNGWPVLTGPMGEIRQVGPDVWQYDALGNATRLRGPLGMLELDFARNSTLRRLRINGELWHYTYDGLGRRIGKTNGRERWQFGWLEGRLVAESYQPTAQAPLRLRHYLYHPDSFTPAAFVEEGQLFVMLADARGAVTHVYDPAGQLVWQGQYSAYGTCTEIVSQVRQPVRLAGQYADSESGLHYNLGRYYAPFVGSYLSVDPRWLDTLDTHPYAYARCDPYGRQDPLGDIAPLLIAVGGAALVGGVVSAGITAWQGGSWRQIGASFAHGALAGAGGAVGAMLGGLPGALLLGGVGSFLGSLVEQAINGEELCFGCAAKDALMDGLFAGLFAGLGKLLGPVLGRLGRAIAGSRMGQAIGRGAGKALAAAKAGLRRAARRIGILKPPRGYIQSLNNKIAKGKQARHVIGTREYGTGGGGSYFNNEADAQAVLDAIRAGKGTYLGTNSRGQHIFRVKSVTGYNHNPGAGYPNQPTDVFIIKGTTKPSVVPTSPVPPPIR